ncbi:molybdopterin-dependent oxidoreductase [Pokkaliibacter sp. MBI-7]|uniref:molybdopterin-dependent oxidoreductase n=1 Tax=Pokkaliibacter sp. MBI-7 TaxID=3040600 RepID=UPI0024477E09|nr:molybdopterin-dependent oxidoreductase [Pokkaliibacter sp. MBI-7]MDH2431797.1 molybdopterin-dependent oxidoreductase [Pokkaliibacter sp. MBI-7]
MKRTLLKSILFGLTAAIRLTALRSPEFRQQLKSRNLIAQIRLKDGSIARHYCLRGGKVSSAAGLHPAADVSIAFHDVATALEFVKPPADQAKIVHAAKHFKVTVAGEDPLVVWFMQLLNRLQTASLTMGMAQRDGTVRYTTNTNGGPLFVYVKDGRIVRTTPIDLQRDDAASWTIQARGRRFSPRRIATVSPHALALRSMVDAENRLLYPMKRVDFDPNGERNPHNRGISGYERISWDEALDIVSGEIKRMKREHGPGAVAIYHSSHHQWGNVGYYLSALQRFGNLIGYTRVHLNPDSWEGWYWGAQHHYGNSMRLGTPGGYGLVEDCLKACEQIVFWSSDPETTSGCYAGFEGTERRLWAKELGIEFIHIDPHYNPTAQLLGGRWIPLRPGSDSALALAIMNVWINEDSYDHDYVATRTTGFEEWRAYLLGETDGVAKTPEWQEAETGVPARDVRALARLWAQRKTYLAAGGGGQGLGGAGRNTTGTQWARSMILLMAMQGWGKPGINFGNLQAATPLDMTFYFPGYAEGGISGDLHWTAAAISNYNRMPHVLSMNPIKQMIPRQKLADAIIDGHSTGYSWDGVSLEAQFVPFHYPLPGHSRVHMLYRYGASSFGTMANSQRMVEAYRHESLEFVVNQSIWHEGETQFADIILPACTMLERWDIGEWAGAGAYGHHIQEQLNHRMIVMQHKCIEPLGESKSDYQIFLEILQRLGLGAVFSEGCSELDWCKRVFDSSDLPNHISWQAFLKKGYFVVPPAAEAQREPAYFRWFAEDKPKDVPEPLPLPSQYADTFGKGLQTPSGKLEFVAQTLQRAGTDNPERQALNHYLPSLEGPAAGQRFSQYPLQLLSSHPRYSFHTYSDGKGSFINDLSDHRILKQGYYYWPLRLSPQDAAARGIGQHDLVRVFNERGAVLCAADITPLIAPGILKAFESSAVYDPIADGKGGTIDRGGCVNLLTSPRPIVKGSSGMASSSCLVQIEKWMETSACPV